MWGRLCAGAAGLLTTVLALLVLVACEDGDTSSSAGSDHTTSSPNATTSSKAPGTTSSAERGTFTCSPAEANRPDNTRRTPPVPRRRCTLPQRGCVTAPGQGQVARPPAPGVEVSRVTKTAIEVAYNLGYDLDECEPSQLRLTVHTTSSGLAPYGAGYPVAGRQTGTLRIERQDLPGNTDYGPPDILFASSTTAGGIPGDSAGVALPPPKGEHRLSDAARRRIAAHREACRADINDRTNCVMDRGVLHPVAGPVTAASAADLEQSIRRSIEGEFGTQVGLTQLKCFNGARCDATFNFSGYPLEMSYHLEALQSVPTCWELTGFRVTRPVPKLGGLAAPVPHSGCTDR
jgi:hypothetical protein